MGPDSVFVTFKVLGKGKVSKVKLFFIEEGGTEWTKLRVPFQVSTIQALISQSRHRDHYVHVCLHDA